MRLATVPIPAARAARNASRTFSTVILFLSASRTRGSADSTPNWITRHPAAAIFRRSGSSTQFTRALHVQVTRGPRVMRSQKRSTRSRSMVNSLSLKTTSRMPNSSARPRISPTTLSAEWARYFLPWTTNASQNVQGYGHPRLVTMEITCRFPEKGVEYRPRGRRSYAGGGRSSRFAMGARAPFTRGRPPSMKAMPGMRSSGSPPAIAASSSAAVRSPSPCTAKSTPSRRTSAGNRVACTPPRMTATPESAFLALAARASAGSRTAVEAEIPTARGRQSARVASRSASQRGTTAASMIRTSWRAARSAPAT